MKNSQDDSSLHPAHWDEIVNGSGVLEEIVRRNFWSVTDPSEADALLNRNAQRRWQHSDSLVPAWAVAGIDPKTGERWLQGVQLKPDTPVERDGKPQKYFSASDYGTEPLFLDNGEPDYWQKVLGDHTTPIVITEGSKKAACLLTLQYAAISLPGVWNAQLKGRLKTSIKGCCGIGRKVYLAFDSDQVSNPKVQDALDRLGRLLIAEGCVVLVARWDSQYKGIDDLCVQAGAEAAHHAIANALTFEEWRENLQQRRPQPDEDETEDSDSGIGELITQSNNNPPQLFADALAVPLKNLAHSLGLSVEPFLVCLLPILGSRLKAGTRLAIDSATDYYAPPIIWGGLVGDSGTLKTPILKALTSPLDDLQQEAFEEYQRLSSEYEAELQRWELLKKDQRADNPKPKPPALKDLYFSDFTIEAIADSMRYYPDEGYLVHIDELAAFLRSMDAYRNGKGSDRQRWLTSHSGSALKVNRKSSEPIYLHRTSISLVGGIQPSVLEKQVLDDPTSEDGLWARFIWVRLPMTTPPGISDRPRFDLSQLLKGIYHSLNQVEAKTYGLSSEAKTLWNEWNSEIGQLIKQEPSGILRATYPKLKEGAARIALIIHIANAKLLASPIETQIGAETLSRAIQFTRWLMSQTRVLYCEIGTGDNPKASRIIKFVNRFKGCGWLKARTVRDWWTGKGKPNAKKCREWMSEIVALGYAVDNGLEIEDSNYQIEIVVHVVHTQPQPHTQQAIQSWTTTSPLVVHAVHEQHPEATDEQKIDQPWTTWTNDGLAVVHDSTSYTASDSGDYGLNGLPFVDLKNNDDWVDIDPNELGGAA